MRRESESSLRGRGRVHGLWVTTCLLMLVTIAARVGATPSSEPVRLISAVTNEVVAALEEDPAYFSTRPEQVWALLDRLVSPHVDFDRVTRFLLGKYRSDMSAAEVARFQALAKPMMMRTYAVAIGDPTGLTVEHADARWDNDGKRCAVRMRFMKADTPSTLVEYKLHESGNEWLLYDVSVAGVSFLSTYRQTIQYAISEDGASKMLDDLTTRMAAATPGPQT